MLLTENMVGHEWAKDALFYINKEIVTSVNEIINMIKKVNKQKLDFVL